jgi:predicted nucleic acid-binding protein
MEQQRYLIDTNVVVDYLGRKLPEVAMVYMDDVIDAVPNVSVVTKIEVLGFNTPDEYYHLLVSFMADALVFDLSEGVVNECIKLRKLYKIKLPDAIIAATAVYHNLVLITRNVKDFSRVDGLKSINPWEMQ